MPELKARHMALASARADPETLHALDTAADEAAARGAPAAAAELMELAIGLGGDQPERRIHAAEHHFNAGDPERARALLEKTLDKLSSGTLRGTALNLLAGVHLYDDNWTEAVAVLERALDDAKDSPALLVQTLIVLAFGQRMISKFDESLVSARMAVTYAEQLGDAALISRALAMAVQLNFMYGHGVDEISLRRAVELEDSAIDVLTPFSASMIEGLVLAWTGQLDAAHARMEALHRRCTERGAENDLTAVASCEALIEIWRGNLIEAARLADEAMERAEQGSGSLAIALSMRAMVTAYVGREHDSRADARAVLDIARCSVSPRLAEWPVMTMGFLEVSVGNYAEALEAVQPMQRTFEAIPGTEIMTASFIPDAVEAMISLGRGGEAEPLIEALECNGRRLDRPWMLAVGARCRSMWLAARGDVEAAARKAQDAMAEHDRLPMPFERARTQLLLGQLHRRQRQKERSRAILREALQAFEAMGTPLWADRVRAELARAEVAPTAISRSRRPSGGSPSWRHRAMTNRDVAAALFISPKTVEANLARIYRKLGIKSRAELGRVVGDYRLGRCADGRLRLRLRLREVAGDRRVDRDARARGRRDDDLLQVAALRRRRLGAQDLVQRGAVVLGQRLLVEGRLADHKVQVGLLVNAEVDLAALDVVDGLGDVRRDGARLRVRHQATRAEDARDAADLGHLIRCGDRGVEVQEAALDLLDQVVAADDVGSCGGGLFGLVTDREHRDTGRLTGAVRQIYGAAHHLVGLARVDAEPDRDLDGGVLLLGRRLLGQLRRLQRRVQPFPVDLFGGFAICLAVLAH